MNTPANYGRRFVTASHRCCDLQEHECLDLIRGLADCTWAKTAPSGEIKGVYEITMNAAYRWPVLAVWLTKSGMTRTALVYCDPNTDELLWKVRVLSGNPLPSLQLKRPSVIPFVSPDSLRI